MTVFIVSLSDLTSQTSVITPVALPETFSGVTQDFSSINVGKYSVPAVADIDGDGLLDLFAGDLYGHIEYYVQADTASAQFVLVDSLFASIDVGGWASPTFTDLDGDGLKDLLIGNLDGNIYHYEQTYSDSVQFALVTDFFNSIDVSFNAAPVLADINRDGLLDMLIGEDFGHIFHYVQNSAFSTDFTLVTGSYNSIDTGFNAAPALTDIDFDGLADLFVGNYEGYISRYEQTDAYSNDFVLRELKFNSIDVGYRSKPFFTDIDLDGYSDLLIGENDGNINRYELQGIDSLDFGTVVMGGSAVSKYLVNVTGEAEYLHIDTMADGFGVSLTGEEYDFYFYQEIYPDSLGMCSDTVYVQYMPNMSGEAFGLIEHTSNMAELVPIELYGNSYIPAPEITIQIADGAVILSWDTGGQELSYNVYCCEDPYGEYFQVGADIMDSWWSEPATDEKRFYYVTATDFSQPPAKKTK